MTRKFTTKFVRSIAQFDDLVEHATKYSTLKIMKKLVEYWRYAPVRFHLPKRAEKEGKYVKNVKFRITYSALSPL